MGKSILITREQEGALQTANKLLALGFGVVLSPLISIVNCDIEKRTKCNADYLLITSFNAAVRLQAVYQDLADVRVITIGMKSSEYLSKLGVHVLHVASDADTLWSSIGEFIHPDASIDFVCGDHIASDLDQKLITAGFKLNKIEVYKSVAADYFDVNVLNHIDTALFYSPRTAEVFTRLVKQSDLSHIECICISQNVAEKLSDRGFKCIKVAENPTDDSVIACVSA